jgi:hypothetical protein
VGERASESNQKIAPRWSSVSFFSLSSLFMVVILKPPTIFLHRFSGKRSWSSRQSSSSPLVSCFLFLLLLIFPSPMGAHWSTPDSKSGGDTIRNFEVMDLRGAPKTLGDVPEHYCELISALMPNEWEHPKCDCDPWCPAKVLRPAPNPCNLGTPYLLFGCPCIDKSCGKHLWVREWISTTVSEGGINFYDEVANISNFKTKAQKDAFETVFWAEFLIRFANITVPQCTPLFVPPSLPQDFQPGGARSISGIEQWHSQNAMVFNARSGGAYPFIAGLRKKMIETCGADGSVASPRGKSLHRLLP